MPILDPADLSERETYFLMTSLVVPRPIAWVGTTSAAGVDNVAPHSYFNMISSDPPIVHFTSSGEKDTLVNVRATGVFTISVVSRPLLEAMNATAADVPPEVSEFDHVDVTAARAETVDAPYVAESPATFECRLRTILSMGTGHMVFGDVTRVRVDDRVWVDGRVDIAALDPVGRLSGSQYTMSETIIKRPRPTWQDLTEA
ncbi:flavin reductase family protein [Euzebya sp.]|uniref:flavin reductase family protein n=1 Tax=Euzebya sp. TaxID=1971409 RepID=UPI003518B39A